MSVLLLRHVHAGDRAAWNGDDRIRPASPQGYREAAALPTLLAAHPIERILSSPATRCLDSVQPLADLRDLPVELDERLAEGTPTDVVRGLLREVAEDHALLCSHGDVIAAAITDLAEQGVEVGDSPEWEKAGIWILDGLTSTPAAHYLPPPSV